MSPRIGYAFPSTCLCAIIVFLPMGGTAGDKSLLSWLCFYASAGETKPTKPPPPPPQQEEEEKEEEEEEEEEGQRLVVEKVTQLQRVLVVGWVVVQLCIPLRMPLISGGEFPVTAQGYRYSWTMMLHSKTNHIVGPMLNMTDVMPQQNPMMPQPRGEFALQLPLFYLAPMAYPSITVPVPGTVGRGSIVPQQRHQRYDGDEFIWLPRKNYMPMVRINQLIAQGGTATSPPAQWLVYLHCE